LEKHEDMHLPHSELILKHCSTEYWIPEDQKLRLRVWCILHLPTEIWNPIDKALPISIVLDSRGPEIEIEGMVHIPTEPIEIWKLIDMEPDRQSTQA